MKKIIWALLAGFLFFLPIPVLAQEQPQIVKTSIVDTYLLNNSRNVSVEREISLIYTTDKYYINQYSFSFKDKSLLTNIRVLEDGQPINFERQEEGSELKIIIPLSKTEIKIGTEKKLNLSYSLINYLTENKNYKELVIPVAQTLAEDSLVDYRVRVITPADFLPIGVNKPPVKKISSVLFEWDNLLSRSEKNLYLAFGNKADYAVTLNYSFQNNSESPKKAEIPLIPEGTYQKIYLNRLNPEPVAVRLDEDQNFLATYLVNPKSTLKIKLEAIVELSSFPRQEIIDYSRTYYQKPVLARYLTAEKFWRLDEETAVTGNSPQDIYNFVVKTLNYSEQRLQDKLTRMGASWALKNPNKAVCMEFTDLFIALSREKGIASREVIGYVYTSEEERSVNPSSFLGDVLHAWPEYFDSARQYWQPIDPTFAKTAGLDYFFNLDLNHLAFVYHGKDTIYPLPPGVYKTKKNSQDIFVTPLESEPETKIKLTPVWEQNLRLLAKKNNQVKMILKNESNVFLYNQKLQLVGPDFKSETITIPILAPLSSQNLIFNIELTKITNRLATGELKLLVNNQPQGTVFYRIQGPLAQFWNKYVWIISLALLGLWFVIRRK